MNKGKHPYHNRLWVRERLPWFFINLGIVNKGKDCESVNAEHCWYNNGNGSSGCYYCKVVVDKKKWERK